MISYLILITNKNYNKITPTVQTRRNHDKLKCEEKTIKGKKKGQVNEDTKKDK
jgi:hypothetical protein